MWLIFVAVGLVVVGGIVLMLTSQNPEVIDEDAAHEVELHPDMKIQPSTRPDPSDERTGSENDARDDGGGIVDV